MNMNMKQQFLDQFGLSVTKLPTLKEEIDLLNNLNLDLIQIPLHISCPTISCIDTFIDSDTQIVGKYVPPKNWKMCDSNFFTTLFKRYKDKIRIWDFFGEPESRPVHQGTRWFGTAEELVGLQAMIYDIGKSIDPTNQIGCGGFLTPTFNGMFGNDDRSSFLEKLLSQGLLNHMDFCSTNTYCYGYGGRKSVIYGLSKIKNLIEKYSYFFGYKDIPIVISEFGAPCAGDPKFLHIIQTERRQAIQVVENTMLHQALGVDYSLWFCWKGKDWGIIDNELEPRESYYAFKTMISMLKNTEYLGMQKAFPGPEMEVRYLTDKIEWYKYRRNDIDIHVFFITGGQSLKCKSNTWMLDMFGIPLDKEFVLTGEPVYAICKKDADFKFC